MAGRGPVLPVSGTGDGQPCPGPSAAGRVAVRQLSPSLVSYPASWAGTLCQGDFQVAGGGVTGPPGHSGSGGGSRTSQARLVSPPRRSSCGEAGPVSALPGDLPASFSHVGVTSVGQAVLPCTSGAPAGAPDCGPPCLPRPRDESQNHVCLSPQDVLESKNSAIKDLQYELARVCKVRDPRAQGRAPSCCPSQGLPAHAGHRAVCPVPQLCLAPSPHSTDLASCAPPDSGHCPPARDS